MELRVPPYLSFWNMKCLKKRFCTKQFLEKNSILHLLWNKTEKTLSTFSIFFLVKDTFKSKTNTSDFCVSYTQLKFIKKSLWFRGETTNFLNIFFHIVVVYDMMRWGRHAIFVFCSLSSFFLAYMACLLVHKVKVRQKWRKETQNFKFHKEGSQLIYK